MASISRSFRSPPSYLSPRRRPTMTGRTLSNSSERSWASDCDEGDRAGTGLGSEVATSGRTTPVHIRRFGPQAHANTATESSPSPSARESLFSSSARPISIELPRINRTSSASVYTPPEPLSARGDLPGGYFPFHEDPRDRIHRPHPFRGEHKVAISQPPADPEASTNPTRPHMPHPVTTSAMSYSNAQLTSYFPTGYSDNQLPMGKYYPTNYENRQRSQNSTPASGSSSEELKSVTSATSPQPANSDAELRRKVQLQQYQRDMIAQVSLAANQIIGSSAQGRSSVPRTSKNSLQVPSGRDARFTLSLHNPSAPRLHPLGSPGPVTPMELSESGSSYLNKGHNASPFDT